MPHSKEIALDYAEIIFLTRKQREKGEMKYKPVTQEVGEIGQINFSGNIIPETWFHAIKNNGKTNINAVLILSEIVWWYRPQEVRDEITGKLIALSRKFHGDLLQRSHQSFAHKFGITKKQSYDACKLLERLGLIELLLVKSMLTPSGDRLGNVLYIRVFPKKIMEITHPLSLGSDRVQPPSDRVQPPSDRVQPPSDRVQPPSDRVQPPSDRVQPPSRTLSLASGTNTEITTEMTTETSLLKRERDARKREKRPVENFSHEPDFDMILDQTNGAPQHPTSQDQSSAPPPSPQNFDFNAYNWASYNQAGAGGSDPGYWAWAFDQIKTFDSARQSKGDPEIGDITSYTLTTIRNRGPAGYAKYLQSTGRMVPVPHANVPMRTRQPDLICSQPIDTTLPVYEELSEEIAIIQSTLALRSWGWVHPQVQLWVCTAQELAKHYAWPPIKFEPALGLSNWPDWAIAKFAKDLEATCIKP